MGNTQVASLKIQEHKLYITRSCGVLAIFGIPLAVMGLVILQVSTLSVGIYSVGLLIFFLGLIISTGRTGIILDCECSTITRWWGLWVPFIRKCQSLDGYDKVVLSQRREGNEKDKVHIYSVQLTSDHLINTKSFSIYESTNLLKSRAFAEHIAKYMGKPLENSSVSELLVRQLSKNKEKLATKISLAKIISPSLNNQISVTETVSGTEISLLPIGVLNAYLIFLPHCIVSIVIGIFVMRNVDVAIIQQSMGFIAIFILSIILALIYFTLKIGKSVTKILIDDKAIKIYQQKSLTQSKQLLKINEIEELFVSELTFRLFPIFTGNIMSLVSSTQTIDVTGIKSTEALYQLKAIISELIGFKSVQIQIEASEFELQNC